MGIFDVYLVYGNSENFGLESPKEKKRVKKVEGSRQQQPGPPGGLQRATVCGARVASALWRGPRAC